MIDPCIVQLAHRFAYLVPHLTGDRPLLEQGHQILGAANALDQDVGPIEGPLLDHAGRKGARHRQPLFTQGRQQTIFSHGPAALHPFKPEPVTHQLAHHAATVVVTQHQVTGLILHEPGHPAADGRAHHLAMGLPPDRIEQGRGRIAEDSVGIPADLVVGGVCQHDENSGR